MILQRTHTLAALAVVATLAAANSQAVDSFGVDVDVYDVTGPEFIAGDGIAIDNFAQDTVAPDPLNAANTISVALKARDRDTGQANSFSGNRYFVDPGFSSTSSAVTNLSIDYQFDPGIDNTTNYILRQSIDFDAGFGQTDFAVISMPIFGNSSNSTLDGWDETDGHFTNPGSGAWNDDTVSYVISNSTRMDFDFWSTVFGKSYDPNALGEYELRLEVLDATGSTVLADTTAFAVVPEPTSLALLGLGGGMMLLRRSRRRSA